MPIVEPATRGLCPMFAGRGLSSYGFTMELPEKAYLSCAPANIDQEKDILCVYCYDLAEAVYNEAQDRAAFGVYVETGGYTDQITDGKHMYAMDVFLKLSEDYSGLGGGEQHNADVRAMRVQCELVGSLDGVAHGMYLALRMTGGETLSGYYLAYTQTYGGIGLEVRTESLSGGTLTVGDGTNYGLVGILVAHKASVAQEGNYYAIVLHSPYEGGAFADLSYGISFQTSGLWVGTDFDVGIDFGSEAVKCINIDACTMAFDADVTITDATNAFNLNVTSTATQASGYNQVMQLTMTHSGDLTGGECHGLAIDMTISGNCPYLYCQTYYIATSGDPTLTYVSAISIYLDNLGDSCADLAIIDIGQAQSDALTVGLRSCYIRMRRHGTVTLKTAIRLEGTSCTNLISIDNPATAPCSVQAGGSITITHKIAVDMNGTTRYIPVGTIA